MELEVYSEVEVDMEMDFSPKNMMSREFSSPTYSIGRSYVDLARLERI